MCVPSRRRHTRCSRDWSSDVCSSDLHSVDTGILIAPALMETINQIGLKAGLEPVMPKEEDDPKKASDTEIALQLKKLEDKEGSSLSVLGDVEESLEEPVVEEQEIPTGLMARRT